MADQIGGSMSLLYRRLSRLPNYLRAFGMMEGPKLLMQVERSLEKRSPKLRSYQVPWAKQPIWLRDTVSDHAIFWQCIVQQQYDLSGFPQTQRLLETYETMVAEGRRPLILDCGGNIGLSAIWFAFKFPKAQIFVLEPEPQNFDLLTRNVAAYSDIVHPLQGGIWARSDRLAIANPEAGAAAFRVQSTSNGGGNVEAYTVNDILRLSKSTEALVVKLDIEGSQKALFAENTDWVGRTHLIILELDDWLYPWTGTSRPFFECVSRYPFDYLLGGEHICCFQDFSARQIDSRAAK